MSTCRSRARWFTIYCTLVVVTGAMAFAQSPPVINAPTQILQQYQSVRSAWLTAVTGYANRLFGILALIEFAWTGIILLLDKTDLQSWTAALIRRMMFIGAFYALLQFGTTWIPAIIDSFVMVGQNASGVPGLSPSGILARGLQITGSLLVGAAKTGWMAELGTALCMIFAAILSFLAFLGLCIQFVVATIESYLVIGAGFLFLGFGGSRWTAPYVERYIAYAVSCGVKIMLIYLLIGAGFILSNGWVTAAQNIVLSAQPATDSLDIAAAAIIFLMICWNAPKLAAAMLGGSPALSGGDAVATGGALIGGAVAIAGLAAGGVALGAKLLAAKGGAMSVSQAAGMGAGGGSGASGLAAGVGARNGGGGRGGAGTATPSNGGKSGGGVSEGTTNQAAPPPFAGTSQGQTSPSDSGAGAASPSQGSAPVAAEPPPASSGPSSSGATGSSTPMSSSRTDPGADESKLRAARASSFAKGTIYAGHAVNQLRSAVPSDAAPPATPPPLHNESHE
jgi:type IV secretion system protein TrbL